jgi:hypothetical protein
VRTVWLRPTSVVVSQIACNANETTLEADSHADTTCLGRGALKLFDYNVPVNVQGYDPSLGAKQFNTVSGALAYIHPFSGTRYHLIVHQAIHMPDLKHHLLCPMQCRAHGTTVNECPRMYCSDPNDESHSIVAEDENGERVILPFFLKGVTSHLNVSPLSLEEFEHHGCPRIELTSRDLTWDPSTDVYEDQENAMVDHNGDIVRPGVKNRLPLMVINSVTISTCADAVDVLSRDNFANALERNVNVSHVRVTKTNTISATESLPSTTRGKK